MLSQYAKNSTAIANVISKTTRNKKVEKTFKAHEQRLIIEKSKCTSSIVIDNKENNDEKKNKKNDKVTTKK